MSEQFNTSRLLIIEDSLSLLRLYTHVLAQAGYTTIQATSGQEAQSLIVTHKPDIVLLDRVLPDIDGSELCQWIKSNPSTDHTYVIMLSALKTSEDDRASGLEAGADDYIVKPVGKRELLARIKVAVRLKRAQLALEASEAKHRTLAENSPDLILRLNPEGFPIYVNPRVKDLFGLTAEDVLGKDAYELGIPDAVAESWFSACRKVIATRSPQSLEFALPTMGTIKFMDARLVPEYNINGEIDTILAVLRDSTEHVRTERLLARLAAAVEQSTDAVVMTAPNGTVQYVNAAFTQLTGINYETSGISIDDLFNSSQGIGDHFRQLLSDPVPWRGVASLRRQDGVLADVEGSIFPIFDESGKVTSVVAILRDVTERRRSEREREVILSVASALRKANSRDEIIDIVLNEIKSLLNVAGAAITTVDPISGGTVIERSVGEYAHLSNTHVSDSQALTAAILTHGTSFLHNDLSKPFISDFPAMQGPIRVFLGVPMVLPQRSIGVIWIGCEEAIPHHVVRLLEAIADMAANTLHRVALFEELEQYAADLEMRVASRTSELAEANQQLRELDRLKSKFVSNVSHELRTPISNLKLYMSLLKRGKLEKRAHYESMLEVSVERLGQLVEDILNLSRLEIAHYQPRELEPTDLNAVINQIVTLHQPQAESVGLRLTFQADKDLPLIQGDYNQLSQLVTNLLVNSLHYTRRGSVNIITTSPNGRENVMLAVEDTGIGILPDDLPHVFERFYRGNHRQPTEIPGTGLGLAIVKEIVDIHHGEIDVESKVDVGTRFEVKLPVRQRADAKQNLYV
jgi:PAS domain S-box-containing protein